MKIDGISGHDRPLPPDAPGRRDVSEKSAISGPSKDDRVELSSEAKLRSKLAATAKGLPDVRQERVDTLREALSNGSHNVEATILARAILEYEDGLSR